MSAYQAVERLAEAIGIDDASLTGKVAKATEFLKMKPNAENYATVAGTGFWRSDSSFFGTATSEKWKGQLCEEEIKVYNVRLAELVPDAAARAWFQHGDRATGANPQRMTTVLP